MATYKRITDVEVVEKNDNMNILVEDAGTLKKISAANIGGGTAANENYAILTVYMEKNLDYEVSVCEANMTYDELYDAITSHKVILGVCSMLEPNYDNDEYYSPCYSYENIYDIHLYENRIFIEFGEYIHVEFYSDGTIVGDEGGNG